MRSSSPCPAASGDSPPDEGEIRNPGIRARMPGFTSFVKWPSANVAFGMAD
jgi:hypothetical protein